MRSRSAVLLVLWPLLLAGCATAPAPSKKALDREWALLEADHVWLQTLRASANLPPESSTRKQQIEHLLDNHRKLEPALVAFLEKLKSYYERTGDPRAASLYASEKIKLGDQYMNVLARYDRAVMMYQNALAIDPENSEARTKMQLAESRRFVAADKFAGIRPGMKEQEVQRIVGMPREDWIKQVVQKSRVLSVWIYPRADGGASAVYFDNGVVYHTNWDAAPAGGS